MTIASKMIDNQARVHYLDYDFTLPFCVMEIGWQKTSPNHTWSPNGRPRYLIHLIKSGKISVTRANGQTTHLSSGDAFINMPDEESTMVSNSSDPCEYYWIAFNGKDAKTIIEKTTKSLYPKYKESGMLAIKKLLDNSISDTIGTLSALFEVLNSIKNESAENENDFVKKSVLYIESNYHNHFDVSAYAKSIGVSRSYFTTAFTKKVGMSPYDYLIKVRIDYAKKFLEHTDLTITQIATKVGFNSIDRFGNIFKKKTKMSPKEYRASTKIIT